MLESRRGWFQVSEFQVSIRGISVFKFQSFRFQVSGEVREEQDAEAGKSKKVQGNLRNPNFMRIFAHYFKTASKWTFQ